MLTHDIFIQRLEKIHGKKFSILENYSYSLSPLKIRCNDCSNEYMQKPSVLMNGGGCRFCSKRAKITNEVFIERAIKIHGNKYCYDLVDCKGAFSKVRIICPIHGVFEQAIKSHLRGERCTKCVGKYQFTLEDFVTKAKTVHGDEYIYSATTYTKSKHLVSIVCKKHGLFCQKANHHLRGRGCYLCKQSLGEKKIRSFLEKNSINFEFQKTFEECKYRIALRFDYYLPEHRMLIEFNGRQHYQSIDFFGGDKYFLEQKEKDAIKKEYAKSNDIALIIIKFNKIDEIDRILTNLLL